MGSLVRSVVRGTHDGADAVSNTMGDVLDNVKSRVDDLVVTAHPRKVASRRRRGGLLLVVVVVVAGAVLVRKRMLRTSTTGAIGSPSSDESAADSRAEVPAAGNDPQDTTVSEDAGSSTSATSAESSTSGKFATAAQSPVSSKH